METAISLLCTLVFFAAAAVAVKRQMHMFQLSSYSGASYRKWLLQHRFGAAANALPLAAAGLARALTPNPAVCGAAAIAALLPLGFLNRETHVKKPLVCTPRVIRMFVTMAAPAVLLLCACLCLKPELVILCETALFAAIPLWILLANLINAPAEAAVRRRYIREAERILRSADTMRIIGVTGSFGKTSVKYFLTSILRAKYDVLMTPGNYNTTLGVVKTVREQYSPTHQIFVCEMGARHVGDIKEICDLVHPDMGIITAVGSQHMETFHSLENIKRTKFELADSLPGGAPLFLNGDDENVMSVPHGDSAVLYGLQNHGGYYADQIRVSEKGTSFAIHTPEGETALFSTQLLGRHNVLNIVGASAVAHRLGIPLSVIGSRVKKLEGVPHRLQLLKNPNGAVIDDAYNSNPQGAQAALEVLSMFDGMKILITPGMVELGENQDACNFAFGRQAAAVCDLVVLVGAKQTKAIREGLLSAQYPPEKLILAESFQEAMAAAGSAFSGGKKYILLENDLPDNY